MMRFEVVNHLLVEQRPPLPGEMPFERRLLPQDATQAKMTPRLIINHTQAASRAIPMDQAWNTDRVRKDGIEAHLLADQQGRGMQCMRFNVVAHTSFKANLFYIDGVAYGQVSVESQDDGGAGLANDPWTDLQLEFLCQAWAAVCVGYSIPVQPVDVWNGQGVSQHNAFPEWSKDAHSCPGPARTAQMPAMRARIQQIIDDDHKPDPRSPAGGLELIAMYQIAFAYGPGTAIFTVSAKEVIHEVNASAADYDMEAGVIRRAIGWENLVALLARRRSVGNPFRNDDGTPRTDGWYDENLDRHWEAARDNPV